MSFSRVYTDTSTVQVTSGTTRTVTIDASVQTGDLIAIGYLVRSALTPPAGFTSYGEVNHSGSNQRTGWLLKISDGTEGGSTVTITQASAGRIEAFHCILRHSSGSLAISQVESYGPSTATTGTLPSLTESGEFVVLSVASNVYATANLTNMAIDASSDTEFSQLNTSTYSNTDRGRIYGAEGIYSGADTASLTWWCKTNTKDWAAATVTIIALTLPSMRGYSGYAVRPYSAPAGVAAGGGGGGGGGLLIPIAAYHYNHHLR